MPDHMNDMGSAGEPSDQIAGRGYHCFCHTTGRPTATEQSRSEISQNIAGVTVPPKSEMTFPGQYCRLPNQVRGHWPPIYQGLVLLSPGGFRKNVCAGNTERTAGYPD